MTMTTIKRATMRDAHGSQYSLETHDYFLASLCDECEELGEGREDCGCLNGICSECEAAITDGEEYACCLDGGESLCQNCFELVDSLAQRNSATGKFAKRPELNATTY